MERISNHSAAPVADPSFDRTFYAGQAARMLEIDKFVSYRQMHNLWCLAQYSQGKLPWPDDGGEWKWQARTRADGWTPYTVLDIAYIRRAVAILRGPEAFGAGRRPQILRLAKACRRIAMSGIPDPLMTVDIRYDPPEFLVVTGETTVNAFTDQSLFAEVISESGEYLAHRDAHAARTAITAEAKRKVLEIPRSLHLDQLSFPI